MGVDYISSKAKTYQKGWDREAATLASPDIFREPTTGEPRRIQGDLCAGLTVAVGELLIVRLTDNGVLACREAAVVAVFTSPPQEIVLALQQAGTIAEAEVEWVGVLGGTIRVSLK